MTRRLFALKFLAATASAAGLVGLSYWALRTNRVRRDGGTVSAGPYAAFLSIIEKEGAVTTEVLQVGEAFETAHPGRLDPAAWLRALAGQQAVTAVDADLRAAVNTMKRQISRRIRTDCRDGAMLQLNGCFLAQTLAELCAVCYLSLGADTGRTS